MTWQAWIGLIAGVYLVVSAIWIMRVWRDPERRSNAIAITVFMALAAAVFLIVVVGVAVWGLSRGAD